MTTNLFASARTSALALGFTAVLLAGAAGAADEIASDPAGIPVVTAAATELWRAGGEDDEVFFGNVGAPCVDADGNLYLMDSQLSQAHVFGPDGEFTGTLGREGDGPGEVRSPSDMFVRADGVVGLLQGFPGRVVLLNPDGTPAGQLNYSTGEGTATQFVVMNRGLAMPDGLCLVGTRMTMGGAVSKQTFFLDICGPDAVRRHNLLEKEYTIDYSDFALDEASMDFVWTRVAVGPDGRVYAAPDRTVYAVNVWSPQGELERVITCRQEASPRDEEGMKIARSIHEAIGAYYPVPPRRITLEDTDPAVTGLWVDREGRMWVQHGRSEADAPDGAWLALDVFGADGKLQRRVGLPGDHDPREDALMLLGDGRYLVVKGSLSAWLSQQAVAQDGADDADPLEVICYRLEN
jgi:hypothetical protein